MDEDHPGGHWASNESWGVDVTPELQKNGDVALRTLLRKVVSNRQSRGLPVASHPFLEANDE